MLLPQPPKLKWLCLPLLALMFMAFIAQAQDPTPAQLQAIQNDLQGLILATSADIAQQALVIADSAAVSTAQGKLASDLALQDTTAAAVKSDEQQLAADVAALTTSASGAKATGPWPGPRPEPRPWINPIPWLNPTPYYPPTPQPTGPGQWMLINGVLTWVPAVAKAESARRTVRQLRRFHRRDSRLPEGIAKRPADRHGTCQAADRQDAQPAKDLHGHRTCEHYRTDRGNARCSRRASGRRSPCRPSAPRPRPRPR